MDRSHHNIDASHGIRDMLFGDVPIEKWQDSDGTRQVEPWYSFRLAKAEMDKGNNKNAIVLLGNIAAMDGLESRHYLQAWYYLRKLHVLPDEKIAKKVYGVIVEVGLDEGLDVLAAYEDGTARYFNYSGKAVIWDNPDASLDDVIEDLLEYGGGIVNVIGVWDHSRPSPPPKGSARLNFLTPSGLHFAQGTMEAIGQDPIAKACFLLATKLMQSLIQKAKQ